ncbi:uncharacterized protein LOC129576970 [Sitodiplosis mosellana]|uniref:uncharacterized protein LOC129576970 n=1 Tax=Sitodiplosis mosellana TaxID=263140 RepID=UPI002444DC85|nr:uncharacterized protein LOC129576970 [Sitodiplosis mosellana]
MASMNLDCLETVFRFKVNIDSLEAGEILSPEIKLSKLSWKIKLCKQMSDDVNFLGIFLVCEPPSDIGIAKWLCNVRVVFKLLSFASTEKEIIRLFSKKEFNQECLSHGVGEFCLWNDLLESKNQYVRDNEATFEVEILTNPLNCIKMMEIEQMSVKLRVVVENVSKLGNTYSPEVIVRGIRWRIQTRKEDEHFAVYLWAIEEDMDMNWCWEVEYSFKLLSFNSKIEPVDCKTTSDVFRWGTPSWGYGKLIKWSEFMDPKKRFVRNDTAIIEVKFAVKSPKPLWECEKNPPKIASALECSICFEKFCGREILATKCGHLFCGDCIYRSIEDRQKCPMCNATAVVQDLRPIFFSW